MNTLSQPPLKKVKKQVFRVGEKVRIVNPEIFVRCGYPKTKEDVIKEITEDDKVKICELLKIRYNKSQELNNLFGYDGPDIYCSSYTSKCYYEILDRLAYFKLADEGFGGKERKVHTELKPEYKDKIAKVRSKKNVQSGIYHSGGGSYEDYEPPYLADVKTHVILDLEILHKQGDYFIPLTFIEIEDCHVERYIEKYD